MLAIPSLDYQLGGAKLFDGLRLEVCRNEHVVIVGGSGSGKSTLLTLIAEQTHPQIKLPEGAVVVMVTQQGGLLDHHNVRENLELVARYSADQQAGERIDQLLSRLNIGSELYSARISQLSGGQLRRVSIARALLARPDLIIFDEPDAGLDVANLTALSKLITELAKEYSCACITVSHNPLYIAGIASKVYSLHQGKLEAIAQWSSPATEIATQSQRQQDLLRQLTGIEHRNNTTQPTQRTYNWVFPVWISQVLQAWLSVLHWPRSVTDECRIAGYTVYLSFLTGMLFFAIVGLMLGTTTVAVVQMLSDSALTGFIRLFIKPEDLVRMMGGRYVLYLAPAIGGMLFAARSGSIVSNWLGELQRGKQVQALRLLGVPPEQYLKAPVVIGVFISMLAAIVWFATCVWLGGVAATQHLFGIADPVPVMSLTHLDIAQSHFWLKTLAYSVIVASTVVALGLAPKQSSHQVNIHTTKTIIYSTVSIALAELVIILSH